MNAETLALLLFVVGLLLMAPDIIRAVVAVAFSSAGLAILARSYLKGRWKK